MIWSPILLPDTVLLRFVFKLIRVIQKSKQISFTDGAGIRPEGEKVLPHSPKIMAAYAFILSSSRFCPSLTGLAVSGGEECGANAEMTLKIVNCVAVWSLMTRSLQVDLVLSDMAATLSWCSIGVQSFCVP